MNVLVFGGSGFIGVYLVEELLSRGHKVMVADIKPISDDFQGDYAFGLCDIMNSDSINSVFEAFKPEVVYNLAGFANLDKAIDFPKLTLELNVIGNINILEAAVNFKVRKFIFASSAYAMSNKGSFYGISKLASEKLVEEYKVRYDLDYVILRYGSLYAERYFDNNYLYKVVQEALNTGVINHNGDGEEVREYIHAADAARLSVDVIEDPSFLNKHIILTGNERMKRKDLFLMVKEIIGNSSLKINLNKGRSGHHYHQTPYSFNPMVSKKLIANPHIDMGQGILECVRNAYLSAQGEN